MYQNNVNHGWIKDCDIELKGGGWQRTEGFDGVSNPKPCHLEKNIILEKIGGCLIQTQNLPMIQVTVKCGNEIFI